jgi:GT2 family glycosyltransferase
MKISVVIPTYHRYERLRRTLASFNNVSFEKEDFEVIICYDDGDKALIINDCPFNVKHLVVPKHIGRAGARNLGLAHAEGSLVFFSDDDSPVAPDCLSKHWEEFQHNNRNINVGQRYQKYCGDSCETTCFDMNALNQTRQKVDIYSLVTRSLLFSNGNSRHWMTCTTANLSVPTLLAKTIKGFDNHFLGWGLEDIEFGYRLCHEGARIQYLPTANNFHFEHHRDKRLMIQEMNKNL